MARAMVGPLAAGALSLALLLPLGFYLSESSLPVVGIGAAAALLIFGSFYFALGAGKEEKEWVSAKLRLLRRGPTNRQEPFSYGTTDKHSNTDAEPSRSAHQDAERP
jgi:hypothetical protein